MAQKLCQLKKKGGNLKETTLWTNSNPTSSFAAQVITLSDSLANFDVCRIYYKAFTTSSTVLYVDYPKDFFTQSQETVEHLLMGLFSRVGAGASYARMVLYNSDTQIRINASYKTADGTMSINYSIPIKLCGLK